MTEKENVANTTLTAAKSRLWRTSSMNSIRMENNCVSSSSPTMRQRKSARSIAPHPSFEPNGPTRSGEPKSLIIQRLAERGIDFDDLANAAAQPEADPFDLLCHIAFNAPLRTRRERTDRLRREKKNFFDQYGPKAKEILTELLEKYAEYGTAQFVIPDVLKVPPLSERGNVMEIADFFGGPEQLRTAVNRLQTLLSPHD